MERHDIVDMMRQLQLSGMRLACDDVMRSGIHEPPCVYRRVKLSKGRPYETGKTHPYI